MITDENIRKKMADLEGKYILVPVNDLAMLSASSEVLAVHIIPGTDQSKAILESVRRIDSIVRSQHLQHS